MRGSRELIASLCAARGINAALFIDDAEWNLADTAFLCMHTNESIADLEESCTSMGLRHKYGDLINA